MQPPDEQRRSVSRRLQWALAGLVLLLALVVTAGVVNSIRASVRQDAAFGWERRSLAVLIELERLTAALNEAETGERGYLLTRNRSLLQPYEHGRRLVPQHLATLRRLTIDSAVQHQQVERLEQVARARLDGLERTLERFDADPNAPIGAQILFSGQSLMADTRQVVARVRAEEERLLMLRQRAAAEAERNSDRAQQLLAVLGIVLLGVTGLGLVTALGAFTRARAERDFRATLEMRVIERTAEIARANARLRQEAEQREAAETQVRQMQKMESLGQLTGGIAHDFNNMLAIVIGSIDMARRRLSRDPEKVAALLDNAEEGATRAAQLTARLLAFSRQQPLAPEPVDANMLVGGMSELLRRTIAESVRMETVLAGGLWRAHVDRGQLENALVNLAINGRDAMPEGGKLTIETANSHLDEAYAAGHADVAPGQYVVVCVTDTGEGMPPAVIERAFDPFFTTKGAGKGTGLGLSQVFGFVKQSGGHVKIYSEVGVGTTVKLYLPRYFGPEGVPADVEPAAETPRGRADEIILVVEDEMRVRHLSVDTLRELGYTVVQASNAEEALEQLAVQPRIDLLFTDIVMPGISGRELAQRARAALPHLKILYTTGYTKNAVVHNGMLDKGVELLPKPFSIDALARRVRALLDGGPARAQQ